MSTPFYIVGIILCVVLSAYCSASEMSFSSANRIRLEKAEEEGDEKAKQAVHITNHFDVALSTILVLNNLVNIAASSLGSVLVILLLGDGKAWVSTVVITIVVIIFGETIPKITAEKNATRFAMFFAPITKFLMTLFRPVTWIVVKLVDLITSGIKGEETVDKDEVVDELHSIIDTAEVEEVIDEDSSELISAAIDFANVSVSEVMTARVDMVAIDIEDSLEEILHTVEPLSYSRIPVYEDSIDNVIGILSMNHFLKAAIDGGDINIRELLMQPYFVYKTTKLPAVLSMLRDTQQHLAIVTDEYGGVLGLVTLEDVMEELVGDIWDETDQVEEEIVETSKNNYELDGDTPIDELMKLLDLDESLFDFESETVGGWCIEMLDGFPKAGDGFTFKQAKVQILEADERRVIRVRLQIQPKEEDQ